MDKGLKLIHLKIVHKGKNLFDVDFLNIKKEISDELFSTVIIGTNGSGKSFLMTQIIEIFRSIENELELVEVKRKKTNSRIKKENSLKYDYYNLKFSVNNDEFNIEIKEGNISLSINNKATKLSNITLPSKLLAVSFMVNDKFVFQNDDLSTDSIYSYLGVRESSNLTFTSSVQKSICNHIINNIHNENILDSISQVLEFLHYDLNIHIIFYGNKLFLKSKDDDLKRKIKHKIKVLTGNRTSYRYSPAQQELKNINVEKLADFIMRTQNRNPEGDSLIYKINLKQSTFDNIELSESIEMINLLIKLRFLKQPTLNLKKYGEFEFDSASSGEKHLLFSLISLAVNLKQNSLVLIDEPEISLHPNWQMQYIDYLKRMFSHTKGCHFLIATHSHFILSDLKGSSSSIVKIDLEKKTNLRISELIEHDTYAWSAENILYNVFQVRTTRNYYFEEDIKKVLLIISGNSDDFKELERLIYKLKLYVFDPVDPINIVIEQATKYLNERLR